MRTRFGVLSVVVAGLVVALIASAGVAAATTTTKHHHHHGKITAVSGDSITIETHHKKNGEKVTTTKTFKLDGNTTVSFKTKSATTAAATSDLKVGQHVRIEDASGTAKTIAIHHKHKKKGAKAAAADAAAAVSAANAPPPNSSQSNSSQSNSSQSSSSHSSTTQPNSPNSSATQPNGSK